MNDRIASCKFVVDNAHFVHIDIVALQAFAETFEHTHIKHWFEEAPFDINRLSHTEKLHFLLIFNAISFSYWGTPKWTIDYHGQSLDGAYGMIAALGKAIEAGFPILDPQYLANISKNDFEKILSGNTTIPLFDERLSILREVGQILIEKYNADFSHIIPSSQGDALLLLEQIIYNFPSFHDTSIYKEKEIYFYKRASLLVADISQAFHGHAWGDMQNLDELTACADYKLPMILRRLGILHYTDELAEKIDNKIPLEHNSEEEIEIRAYTIWAVELLKRHIQPRIHDIASIHINDHLWLLSQTKVPEDKPYHLTRTTAY